MFIKVRLLQGYQKPLMYKVPSSWNTKNLHGSIITVPLKNKIVPALVIKVFVDKPEGENFQIKEAAGNDHLPDDKNYTNFITKIANFYFTPQKFLYQRIRKFVHARELKREKESSVTSISSIKEEKIINLTDEQQKVVDYFIPLIKKPNFAPTLLHGVTGSGKTEIYKKIILSCIKNNKTVLLLLPEVSLSMQFENILSKQLPKNIKIYSFHSATKTKDKKRLWEDLLAKKPILIIGVHLPIILPIANLGTIIVDEEHESGFQEKKHPKINSKEVALWRAKLYNVPILLGSATPSLNSFYNVKKQNWKLFSLTKRFAGTFPKVNIVKIKKEYKRKYFWVTKELEEAISDRLSKKEQIIIYINRRGYSFFVQCKECGFTFTCPNCSVSLTLHKDGLEHRLCCHYCDYSQASRNNCPECHAGERSLLKRGVGTQQIVSILQELFPTARIARADLDTTKKKRLWSQTVEQFEAGELDILVGTQTITKGYHFPHVTLVGIIWADLNLHFPVFNAAESSIQQLIQVAGRAGRMATSKSLVIAQVIDNHPVFEYINEEKYLEFCKTELSFRKEANYPPFGRFVQIELKNIDPRQVVDESERLSDMLTKITEQKALNVTVLGPSKPLVYRIQKTEIRHIFLKSDSFGDIYTLLRAMNLDNFGSQVFVVPT
jgi:primosomal protein N' (replication factor Y)